MLPSSSSIAVNPVRPDAALPGAIIYRHTLGRPSEPWVWQQALRFQSFRPHFLCREGAGALPSDLPHREFLPQTERSFRSRLVHGLSASPARAMRVITREQWQPALLHAHFAFDAVYARRIARRLAIPLVVTLHGIDVAASNLALVRSGKLAWWHLLAERSGLGRDATAFLCVSEHVRQLAARFYPADKLHTAFLGVDTANFTPSPLVASPSVLFVGRLVEKKGTRYLLEAFHRTRAVLPRATLTIVGAGPLEAALQAQIRSLGLDAAVTHIRQATPLEIKRLLAAHRVFCLPSVTAANGDTEGLPISLLEAMASAKPVVSTWHAGIPEAVTAGQSGLLAAERDVRGLAERLVAVLSDDGLAQRLAAAAREKSVAEFDLGRCAARTEAIYRESLRRFHSA